MENIDSKIVRSVVEENFEGAVLEYVQEKSKVWKQFLLGCVGLWRILHRHRDTFKVQRTWCDYIERVGISMSAANQQIRIYEKFEELWEDSLVLQVVTNWSKMQDFLSLDSDQVEELEEKVEAWELQADSSSDEFREVVKDIKGEQEEAWENLKTQWFFDALAWEQPQIAAGMLCDSLEISQTNIDVLLPLVFLHNVQIAMKNNKKLFAKHREKVMPLYKNALDEIYLTLKEQEI